MTRPVARRILALALVLGLVGQAVLIDNLFGVNLLLLSVGLLAATVLVRPDDARLDPADIWLPISALAVVAGVAIRADPLLNLIDTAAGCVLLGASIAAIGGIPVTRRSILGIVVLGTLSLGWLGAGIVRVASLARRTDREAQGASSRLPVWARPVVRGLLLATPILIVFAALFAAADAVFASFTARLFDWQVDLGELPIRLVVAFVLAWPVAGLLAVGAGSLRSWVEAGELQDLTRPRSLGAAAADVGTIRPFVIGSVEAITVLVAVDILFAVFVVLQLAYLFGGLDTLAASGLPYAQYARSGFFELVVVAVLAGGLLAAVHALAARRTVSLVASGIGLAALTGVILASALMRLRIYQDAYGWTELRFYVLATIVWLAIGIAIVAVLLIRDEMRWLVHGLTIAAVVVLIGVNIVGPSRLIAAENVARVLDPARVPADGRSGLDVDYAAVLGDDAVPALVEVLPALGASDRARLLGILAERQDALGRSEATGWPAWNLGRSAARDAMRSLPGG